MAGQRVDRQFIHDVRTDRQAVSSFSVSSYSPKRDGLVRGHQREYICLRATSVGHTFIHPGPCTTTLNNYLVCITVGKPCTDTSTLSCCTQQVLYEGSRTPLSLSLTLSHSLSLPLSLSLSPFPSLFLFEGFTLFKVFADLNIIPQQ